MPDAVAREAVGSRESDSIAMHHMDMRYLEPQKLSVAWDLYICHLHVEGLDLSFCNIPLKDLVHKLKCESREHKYEIISVSPRKGALSS